MAKVIKNDKLIVNTKWDVYKHVLTGLKQSLENNPGHKYDTIYLSFGNIESIRLEQATNKAIVTVLQSKSTWYRDEVRNLSTKLKEMSKTNFENCEKIWKKIASVQWLLCRILLIDLIKKDVLWTTICKFVVFL